MVDNEQFKDCCTQKHEVFRGASLLVQGEVHFDCSTDMYVILNGDLTGVYYRDEIVQEFVHPYAGAMGQDFVLMNGNAHPHRACVVNEYIERGVHISD